jgi:hypothetical protein
MFITHLGDVSFMIFVWNGVQCRFPDPFHYSTMVFHPSRAKLLFSIGYMLMSSANFVSVAFYGAVFFFQGKFVSCLQCLQTLIYVFVRACICAVEHASTYDSTMPSCATQVKYTFEYEKLCALYILAYSIPWDLITNEWQSTNIVLFKCYSIRIWKV